MIVNHTLLGNEKQYKSLIFVSIADGKRVRLPGQRWLSNRTVKCLTNVEAFSIRAEDLEEVTTRFMRFLRNLRVQGSLRSFISLFCCICYKEESLWTKKF